ncbi:MAG: TRAP transporter small permease [Sneathiellales bacterium]|nr:TRAP transporter small permease [Sneathiellales bacterium]
MDYRSSYPLILQLVSRGIDIFLATAGIVVLFLIFTNAVLRGAAGFDLAWSLEVTAFLLLWLTFLGCAAAASRGAHMRVTELVEHLVPDRAKPFLEFAISLVVLVLLLTLIQHGHNIVLHTWAQKTTVLYWPVGLLYASMPIGMALTLLFHLYNMYLDIRRARGARTIGPNNDNDHDWEDYE